MNNINSIPTSRSKSPNRTLPKIKCAIIGSGNIGTDLMIKIIRLSSILEMAAFVGIDPDSDGLARAKKLGVTTTHEGLKGLRSLPEYPEIKLIFDATSAKAHAFHNEILQNDGKQIIDLTPAALGPYTIPSVNLDENLNQANVNMVTCGGQATIPIIAAISQVSNVQWGEIIASIASRSAGPGTRANIDEFTQTTANAIEKIGKAKKGKAIIILNPAEPPLIMRDTVHCLCTNVDKDKIIQAIEKRVKEVQDYVPGYRLKQPVQIETISHNNPLWIPELNQSFNGLKVSVYLEVEGAAHYLPSYAGNLDIMTSAALKTAERLITLKERKAA